VIDLRAQVSEKKELKLEIENLRLQVDKMEMQKMKAADAEAGIVSPPARGKVRF
jgi:hypothetical protein